MNQDKNPLGWWLKIVTAQPLCIYYFGVFNNSSEARYLKNTYIQDLQQEGATIIEVLLEHCQPKQLTIEEHELEVNQEFS